MKYPRGNTQTISSVDRWFGRRRHYFDLVVIDMKFIQVSTYALRKPNVQKMEKKPPTTQSHPRVPPSEGSSGGSFAAVFGTFSLVEGLSMPVSVKYFQVECAVDVMRYIERLFETQVSLPVPNPVS